MSRKGYDTYYYYAHRVTVLAKRRAWYVNNRERALAGHARWKKANREAIKLRDVLGIPIAEARQRLQEIDDAKVHAGAVQRPAVVQGSRGRHDAADAGEPTVDTNVSTDGA